MIALSRKNALFAGSDEGAENWAILASLIESCKLHGVNPEAYLTDVLTNLVNNCPIAGLPNSRLGAGLPHSDRRRRIKPVVKQYRSWPQLIAYGQPAPPGDQRPPDVPTVRITARGLGRGNGHTTRSAVARPSGRCSSWGSQALPKGSEISLSSARALPQPNKCIAGVSSNTDRHIAHISGSLQLRAQQPPAVDYLNGGAT